MVHIVNAIPSFPDMKGSVRALAVSNTTEVLKMQGVSGLSDPPELPEEDDLPFDFHETFGFLDLMDSSASNQVC